MEVLYPRCAALDVHKDTVVAAIRLADGSKVQQEVRTLGLPRIGGSCSLCVDQAVRTMRRFRRSRPARP